MEFKSLPSGAHNVKEDLVYVDSSPDKNTLPVECLYEIVTLSTINMPV